MAMASSSEAEHHLGVYSDLGLLERSIGERLMGRCAELRRMLFGLRRALLAAEVDRVREPSAVNESAILDSRLDDSGLTTQDGVAGTPGASSES
jgi:hypothetical protein